jgi:hypothetical protein
MTLSTSSIKHDRVFISSGHLIDKPDRPAPRFPPEKEYAIAQAIAEQLEEWKPVKGDLAICGAARGSDILFAENCLKYGIEIWLFIAKPEEEFLKGSVRLPKTNWEDRYFSLRENSNIKTFFQPPLEHSSNDMNAFARANLWMIETAKTEAGIPDKLFALLVWDEKLSGDGPGGTSDFAARIKSSGDHLKIINPSKLT